MMMIHRLSLILSLMFHLSSAFPAPSVFSENSPELPAAFVIHLVISDGFSARLLMLLLNFVSRFPVFPTLPLVFCDVSCVVLIVFSGVPLLLSAVPLTWSAVPLVFCVVQLALLTVLVFSAVLLGLATFSPHSSVPLECSVYYFDRSLALSIAPRALPAVLLAFPAVPLVRSSIPLELSVLVAEHSLVLSAVFSAVLGLLSAAFRAHAAVSCFHLRIPLVVSAFPHVHFAVSSILQVLSVSHPGTLCQPFSSAIIKQIILFSNIKRN